MVTSGWLSELLLAMSNRRPMEPRPSIWAGAYRVYVDNQHEDNPVTALFAREDAIESALAQLDDEDVTQVWVTDPFGTVIFRSSDQEHDA